LRQILQRDWRDGIGLQSIGDDRVDGWIHATHDVAGTPDGRLGRICEIAASISSVLLIMLRPQPKSIEIWAEPRELAERTSSTPGTERIASSTGRVTSKAVWSAGRLPASRSTTTARKGDLREKPNRQRSCRDQSGRCQSKRYKENGAGVPFNEFCKVHCALLVSVLVMRTAALSDSW